MRRLAYRDEGGLGAIDEATERARAEELLRVGRGREGEREDAQHGEEHRRQKDEVTLRLAVPSATSSMEESGRAYRWGSYVVTYDVDTYAPPSFVRAYVRTYVRSYVGGAYSSP